MTTVLSLIGVAWIACAIAAALMWHGLAWPHTGCRCGRWVLDSDCGVVLPLVDHDAVHDRERCQPPAEYIAHPEGRGR